MKEKLKDGRVLATLSIVFFILLCIAILDWEGWFIVGTEIFHIISAILFGISYIGFLIFGTKKNGIKIISTIIICSIALCGLFFWLRPNYNVGYYYHRIRRVWKDISIVFAAITGVSIIALLLNLIRRPTEQNNRIKKNKISK